MIKTEKTVYDITDKSDGQRILVMRYWPRGVKKDKVDVWLRDVGTEKELIKKWKAGSIDWEEFAREYREGLSDKRDILRDLSDRSKKGTITLLCSCKDAKQCHRTILAEEIIKQKT